MAEVKRAASGPSFPIPNLKKKPPSFSNSGVISSTSSFKHIYDDVFGSSSPSRMNPSSSFMEDDYAEVFGSSKSSNGAWNISYSSIPVLDLPMKEAGVGKQGAVDYGGVFGGVGESGCFGLPDGEELFDHLKKKHKTSPSHTLPRSQGQRMEATSQEISSQSYDGRSPTNGFCQSFDNMKHFKSGNKMAINAVSGPKKAAHIRAYSLDEVSATLKTSSCQEAVIKGDMLDTDSNLEKKQGIHARHTSLDFGVNNQNSNSDAGFQKVFGSRGSFSVDTSHDTCQTSNFGVINQNSNSDAGFQKVSGMTGSYTVDTSHDTCQPSNTSDNGFCQSLDNTIRSEYKNSKMSTDRTSRTTYAADVHRLQESNCSLDELEPNQHTLSNRTPVLRDKTQSGIDVNLEKEQGKHSCSTSLDVGVNRQNEDCDNVFQKACGLSESTSDTSHRTCQASVIAGPSKVVKDDAEISISCNELKKKGRRSKMTSLDLGDNKLSCEHDDGLKRKPRFGGSYSFDASHDPCAARIKVQPSKMYPSSSLPQFFPVESLYKVSENSSSKSSQKNLYRDAAGSPPSLAEELDVNSAAAVSAAALQKAIEEAEMRIRLAKAFLERECQGSTNLRFKDTLKMKISKENGLVNEIKQTKMHKCSPIDSDMQPCSPLERKSVVENAKAPQVFEDHASPVFEDHVPPVFEDQKKFFVDGELTEENSAKASNFISGDDKHEGEWEAAKHLNQLISGVKSRLASFMSWQTETDTEKKEETKEVEATIKPQQQPEEVKHDFKDHETSKRKKIEDNQGTTTRSGEEMHGENKTQSASEAHEPEETESFRSFNVIQEKAGNTVDFIPDTAGSRPANFQFFAFRNQILCDPPDPNIEEKKGLEESRESEIENEQEQVINAVENEHIPWQDEEARLQESDDKYVIQDIKRHDDMYRMSDIGSSDEENEKTVEEPCSQSGNMKRELSPEEDRQSLMEGNSCFVNEENVEMLEEHYSVAGHDKEPTHEEGRQDDANSKSHVSSFIEENNEIVEEYSFAENDEEGLTHEDDGQYGLFRKNHLGSSNDERNEIVKQFCSQAAHERNSVVHEEDNDRSPNVEFKEKSMSNSHLCEIIAERTDKDDDCEVLVEAKHQHENIEVGESWKTNAATEGVFESQENDRNHRETNHIEEISGETCGSEEIKIIRSNCMEETPDKVILQASSIVSAEEGCKQNENVYLSKGEYCSFVESSSEVEKAAYTDEEIVMARTTNTVEPEMDIESQILGEKANELIEEEPVISSVPAESNMKLDRNGVQEDLNDTNGTLPHEHLVAFNSESDMSSGHIDVDVKVKSPDNLENQTDFLHDSGENLHAGEFDNASDQDAERSGVEAGHRRRRWFDNSGNIGTAEQPSILEGNQVELEVDQEVLDESELAGSVEIHADKLDCNSAEVTTVRDVGTSSNQDGNRTNIETTPTRKKWFVKRGEEGVPEPLSLFEGIKVNLEVPLESANESIMQNISGHCLDNSKSNSGESLDAANNGEKGKLNGEAAPRRRRWFEGRERVGPGQHVRINEDVGLTAEIDQESNKKEDVEKLGKLDSMSVSPEKDDVYNKVEPVKEHHSDLDDLNRKEKEREKEKIAVERAIREARERAFAEARERARRDASERPNVEARQKVVAGIPEKLAKVSSEASSSLDKASMEAKLKAERAAVERATAEARERALQKSLSEKASHRSREQAGRYSSEKNSSLEPKYQSSRCSDSSDNGEKYDGADVESAQRRKARLERQNRTTERATSALEEKNRRDLLAQKEQAAKNMLADSLDAEVKRWSTGKEGNLRALLSTLQYILGPDSGWQPVSLTDLVAATAVRKSYKKATLCVHPDKLQQRGATIQQKYICEKVFDLLKEAWSKFNPDER